jgi:hypothetical protein
MMPGCDLKAIVNGQIVELDSIVVSEQLEGTGPNGGGWYIEGRLGGQVVIEISFTSQIREMAVYSDGRVEFAD